MNLPDQSPAEEFSPQLKEAFEEYPRITASADFNRRVLDAVLQKRSPSRVELLCDQLDEIFARPLLKLMGATLLGIVLAWAGIGSMSPQLPGEEPSPVAQSPATPLFAQNTGDFEMPGEIPGNRLALSSRMLPDLPPSYFDTPLLTPELPARRENTPDERSAEEQRSSRNSGRDSSTV